MTVVAGGMGVDVLRIRLLGGLTVEGLDEHDIGSRKGRTVLKVLALARGAPVAADRIADAVWGEHPPTRPADQVGVLVSRLRAVLGPERVPRTDAGYALRCDWLDVDELLARVTEAERRRAAGQPSASRAAAEAALTLVRGPLLPEEDGAWVDTDRAAARALAHRARLVLAESAVDAGDHGTAVVAAAAMLVDDPYDEAALRALMRAHAAAGRPASALAAYADARERLAEDLGASPSAATEALHRTLLQGKQAPAPPAPPASPLVGRDAEAAVLARALDEAAAGRPVLVAIEGEPGIGKSVLLDAVSASAADRGFTVVRGCTDALGRDLPLQPLLDGLAAALRSADLDTAADVLGPDAPLLEPLLGRPLATGTPGATVLTDAASARLVLFAALLAAFERLAGARPLLIAVDDAHAADTATREWLRFAVRRGRRVAVVVGRLAGRGTSEAAERVVRLGPLDVAAAARLVGEERAAELHRRSGGNPFFLTELRQATDALPAGVREVVSGRAAALGTGVEQVVRTAAVLGPHLDVDLLATVLGRPVAALLDDADAAAGAGLLAEHGATYAFPHELTREALAAGVSAARRAFVHREAARALADRGGADPRLVAWHARQGGDAALAAEALAALADRTAARHELGEAERVLSQAIALADGPRVRLARARVRIARWDVVGAAEDAKRATALGAGAAALETAGWVAYYARDYETAQRYADEGAVRASDETLRASCLALAGRTRHSLGALEEAEPRLVEAAQCRVAAVRGVAQAYLASLRMHQGDSAAALDLSARALLEAQWLAQPFAVFNARFARAVAIGMQGRAGDLRQAAEQFEQEALRSGELDRFVAIGMNLRAWSARAVGRTGEAVDLLHAVVERCEPGNPVVAEPRHVAMLDVAETLLDVGDAGGAATHLESAARALAGWDGTMAWRARQRARLLRARLFLAQGDFAAARQAASALADEAGRTGNARHALFAAGVAAEATALGGESVDRESTERALDALDRCAGLESWRVTARLAAACGVTRWRRRAEDRAAAFVAAAGPLADDARGYVGRALEATAAPR